jgi:hypothetical protein
LAEKGEAEKGEAEKGEAEKGEGEEEEEDEMWASSSISLSSERGNQEFKNPR